MMSSYEEPYLSFVSIFIGVNFFFAYLLMRLMTSYILFSVLDPRFIISEIAFS